MTESDPIHLEEAQGFIAPDDSRPKMPEPLPVRLVAVNDVGLPAPAGRERELDAFYIGLLGFARDYSAPLAYRAENFRLIFDVNECRPERDDYRIQTIEIQALAETEKKLIEAEIEYSREKGIMPGVEVLVLRDPAGNWLQLCESRPVA